jgi:selenocysteine-specific elongation factor
VAGGNPGSPLTIGTAGHIDHGKTILIEALTGTNTDRLPEERSRGISIELGFASFELPSGRRMSVVDVPGHERFVRTMVAGATGIDLFLLVVAADDGVMPQTREHVAVLRMLGVGAGVVAVTKTDLVDEYGLQLALNDVSELLADGPYQDSELVPVCAPARLGLDELAIALEDVARDLPGREGRAAEARLHVDRAFTLRGVGTVVTGTLWSGSIARGDEVRIEPAGRVARVRGVQVHDHERERAGAGQRVALNLAGVARDEVRRGDVITAAGARLRSTYLVDAALELLPAAGTLPRGARVHLHHGTRETPARLAPVEQDKLQPGRRAYVQLRLEQPIVPAIGDRFVVRRVAPPDTIGGGTIVDPAPRKHGAGGEHADRLRLLESGDARAQLEGRLAGAPGGLGDADADPELLERLVRDRRAVRVAPERPRYFAPAQLARARRRLLEALAATDSGRPQSREALADAAGLPPDGARAVLEDLIVGGEAVRRGPGFAPATHAGVDEPSRERLLALLEQDFLEPRSVDTAAQAAGLDGEKGAELLDALALDGLLVRVKPGIYYHPRAIAEAERVVAEACRRAGSITIAELRDALGTTRKYAQALLEHFDSSRLTLRRGDRHVLRRRANGARV